MMGMGAREGEASGAGNKEGKERSKRETRKREAAEGRAIRVLGRVYSNNTPQQRIACIVRGTCVVEHGHTRLGDTPSCFISSSTRNARSKSQQRTQAWQEGRVQMSKAECEQEA